VGALCRYPGTRADEAGSGGPQLTEAEDATIQALLQTADLEEDESDVESLAFAARSHKQRLL
jgi:hypothetical protein